MRSSPKSLGAEGWFIQYLDDVAVWIFAIQRAAAVTMGPRGGNDRNLLGSQNLSRLINVLRIADEKTEMVEMLPALKFPGWDPVQGKIIASRR